MGKKRAGQGADPDFSNWRPDPAPLPVQIVAIRYADGRELTLDAVGDEALLQELREYIKLRKDNMHHKFVGMSADDLRDVARDIAEVDREQVSERNSRTGPRGKAKEVTKQDLLAFRDQYERDKAMKWGWMKAASRKFGISQDTVKARLR